MPGPAFVLSGVHLVEQGNEVLRDLDWTAAADERWVVLGPNGSGKTSILRLLSFVRGPSRGTVTVLGDTYGAVDVRRARRRIGLASSALLQQLRPSLSAHDAVLTGADAALETWWSTYDDARARAAPMPCSSWSAVPATRPRSWPRSRKASASGSSWPACS